MESIERHYKWRKKEKKSLHDQSGDARTEVQFHFAPCSRLYQKSAHESLCAPNNHALMIGQTPLCLHPVGTRPGGFPHALLPSRRCIQNSNLSEPLEGW
ncbi:hypothetical protein CV944_07990 [Geobacillus sp. WSUCF-018B]|nr:hypothetical protein CV944_07990 [Geobacillus sp. WSUCF-018B]